MSNYYCKHSEIGKDLKKDTLKNKKYWVEN